MKNKSQQNSNGIDSLETCHTVETQRKPENLARKCSVDGHNVEIEIELLLEKSLRELKGKICISNTMLLE
jgi:hypothetical protein